MQMPMGFCYQLAENERALQKFGAMNDEEKRQVLAVARGLKSKSKVRELVRSIAEI